MPGKLVGSDEIELSIKGDKLNYQTKEEVVRDYMAFRYMVYDAQGKLAFIMMANLAIFALAIFVNLSFLLGLFLTFIPTMKAQFNHADLLDEQQRFAGKHVVRVDGKF